MATVMLRTKSVTSGQTPYVLGVGRKFVQPTVIDLEALRRDLEAQRDELSQTLRRRDDIRFDRSADEVEHIESQQNADLAARAMNTLWRTKNAVDDALQRIKTGSYGVCEECGCPIHPNRLRAIPWAALCVLCQEQQDREAA